MSLIPYEQIPGAKDPPLLIGGEAAREFYCGDAQCDCQTGNLVLRGVGLVVDLHTGRVDLSRGPAGEGAEGVRRQLAAALKEEGVLERLRAHYQETRVYGTLHLYEHLDWSVWPKGEPVPYGLLYRAQHQPFHAVQRPVQQAVLGKEQAAPGEPEILFRLALSDAYCVEARCECQTVYWKVLGAPSTGDTARELGTMAYSFRKQEAAVIRTAPGVDPDHLFLMVHMLLMNRPEIVKEHEERYARVRKLLIPLIAKQRRERHTGAASDPRKSVGRNHPCPCGSGRKYKKCHGQAAQAARPR